jgi:hypothetical protein
LILQESGIKVTLVTADGDSTIHSIINKVFGDNVLCHHDPNHYAKGLEKSFNDLMDQHPSLSAVQKKIKAHFLLGVSPI